MSVQLKKTAAVQARVEGDVVFLRRLELDDVTAHYLRWLNDPEISQFLETRHRPQTAQTIREFVERVNARDDEFLFGIFLKKDGRHVGNIKVGPVKQNHSLADVSLLIGERDCWGQGIATDAIRAVSRFAFQSVGLLKLNAAAYAANRGSLGAFLRAGYAQEGLRRKTLYPGRRARRCRRARTVRGRLEIVNVDTRILLTGANGRLGRYFQSTFAGKSLVRAGGAPRRTGGRGCVRSEDREQTRDAVAFVPPGYRDPCRVLHRCG
jgi:RimJ/RimL family protein N-acetyltransferase